jgi:uncharacterized protein YjdB
MDAFAGLELKPTPIDKGGLQAAIDAADKLTQSSYTATSWATLTGALTTARPLLTDDSATQVAVDNAKDAVLAAIDGLVAKDEGDTAALTAAVASAEAKITAKASYTTDSWAAADLEQVVDDVNTLLAGTPTQAQVQQALAELLAAMDKLVSVNASGLLAAIELASKIDLSAYTDETAKDLTDALDAADAVKSSSNQTVLDNATKAILDAIDDLEAKPAPDVPVLKDGLNALVAVAEAKVESDYQSGWETFTEALSDAKDVQADANATQEQVDQASSALTRAIDGLVAVDPPDAPVVKTVLDATVSAVAGLKDADAYTAASWKALQDALAAAEQVAASASASQADVDTAATNLIKALGGLEAKPSTAVVETEVTKVVPSGKQIVATKVKFGQSSVTLAKGRTFVMKPAVYFTKGTPNYVTGVTYKSSNPKVATVDKYGQVKAKKKGTAKITATTKDPNAKGKKLSTSYTVKVVAKKSTAKVKSVSLPKVPKTMKVGQVLWLTGKYSTASAQSVKITYTSKTDRVLTIDSAGRLVAESKGKDVITVKAGGKTKKYTVTVK